MLHIPEDILPRDCTFYVLVCDVTLACDDNQVVAQI